MVYIYMCVCVCVCVCIYISIYIYIYIYNIEVFLLLYELLSLGLRSHVCPIKERLPRDRFQLGIFSFSQYGNPTEYQAWCGGCLCLPWKRWFLGCRGICSHSEGFYRIWETGEEVVEWSWTHHQHQGRYLYGVCCHSAPLCRWNLDNAPETHQRSGTLPS